MDAALRAPWPLSIVVMLVLLIALDIVLRAFWSPHPTRLPEQFSAPFLERYVDAAKAKSPVLILGDSTLWGYHLDENEAAGADLGKLRPGTTFLNLSYEGGSIVNSYFALRLALARGVAPAAVIVNLNSKEFNPADSAYKRLQPSLERSVTTLLSDRDRSLLTTLATPTIADRLDAGVAGAWALYRYRVDLRVALFGFDDFTGLVTDRIHRLTGEQMRYDRAHKPTPDAFLGTYNLDPIDASNVELIYLRELRDELTRRHIPAIAFLTPTNHQLVSGTDDPAYADNLHRIAAALQGPGIRVVDLDRFGAGAHFIDNDHLDAAGSKRLAERLATELDTIRR